MGSEVVTTSSVISFVEKLEDATVAFYEQLADRFGDQPKFDSFAKESAKIKVQVVRTYRETISDALEACYSFEGLVLDDYAVDTALPADVSLDGALAKALALEEKAVTFYQDVAERSQALLATIPRAFSRAAKKRAKRGEELKALKS